jgi:penicillin-binding protein 1A
VAPLLVSRIEDASGNVIATFDSQFTDIMDREDAYKMIVMMRGVINEGTGRRLRGTYNIKADLCGKTGTTNSNADGWFMGVAPKLVVGTWVGGEERDIHFISTYYGQGAGAALPVFALFIKKVYADPSLVKDYGITPNDKFEIPTDFDVCEGELTGLQRAERRDEVEVDESVGEIDELFQ